MAAATGSTGDQHSVHFAVYRFKDGSPLKEIERGFDELCAMAGDVPGIRLVSWGLNSSEYAMGYTHAMVIVGDDADAVRTYRELARKHPVAEVAHVSEEAGIGADYSSPATT
jgi:hypothetical protein